MPAISERIRVNSPFGRAPAYLQSYLDTLEKDGGGKTRLRLQASLKDAGLPSGLVLAKDVIAEFEPVTAPGALEEKTSIAWQPQGGGPYPTFRGFLTIGADEDYGASWLFLDGSYEPPFGAAGAVFDLAIGKRIAQATARELLERLREALEAAERDAITR